MVYINTNKPKNDKTCLCCSVPDITQTLHTQKYGPQNRFCVCMCEHESVYVLWIILIVLPYVIPVNCLDTLLSKFIFSLG